MTITVARRVHVVVVDAAHLRGEVAGASIEVVGDARTPSDPPGPRRTETRSICVDPRGRCRTGHRPRRGARPPRRRCLEHVRRRRRALEGDHRDAGGTSCPRGGSAVRDLLAALVEVVAPQRGDGAGAGRRCCLSSSSCELAAGSRPFVRQHQDTLVHVLATRDGASRDDDRAHEIAQRVVVSASAR